MHSESADKRPYKTAAWRKLRTAKLTECPLCVMCLQVGDTKPATVVDHVIPHKGDRHLFHDYSNLQSLCKRCHDAHKQRQERSGMLIGNAVDGRPIDVFHHWNN